MAVFRLYLMDWWSGHIRVARDIDAHDAAEATRLAQQEEHRPLELWLGSQKIRRFERPDETADAITASAALCRILGEVQGIGHAAEVLNRLANRYHQEAKSSSEPSTALTRRTTRSAATAVG